MSTEWQAHGHYGSVILTISGIRVSHRLASSFSLGVSWGRDDFSSIIEIRRAHAGESRMFLPEGT